MAIATQHRCSLSSQPHDLGALLEASLVGETLVNQSPIRGSDEDAVSAVVNTLSLMSPDEFTDRHIETAAHRRNFLARGDSGNMERLLSFAVDAMRPRPPSSESMWAHHQ